MGFEKNEAHVKFEHIIKTNFKKYIAQWRIGVRLCEVSFRNVLGAMTVQMCSPQTGQSSARKLFCAGKFDESCLVLRSGRCKVSVPTASQTGVVATPRMATGATAVYEVKGIGGGEPTYLIEDDLLYREIYLRIYLSPE